MCLYNLVAQEFFQDIGPRATWHNLQCIFACKYILLKTWFISECGSSHPLSHREAEAGRVLQI